MHKIKTLALTCTLALASAGPAIAATITVTPTDMQGWTITDFRGSSNGYTSATVGAINGVHAPAGETGSVQMSTTDSSGKVDFSRSTVAAGLTFGNLTSLSYDWYRSGASTTTGWLAPALRIVYDADGILATTADQGYLIFEPVYNELASTGSGNLAAPTDTWVHEDVFGANFWQRQLSPGANTMTGASLLVQSITGWKTQAGDGDLLSNASRIIGINFGVGSGWVDGFDGAVDHVTIGTANASLTYNFEAGVTAAVPEPQTYALMALGLGALAMARRRSKAVATA